MPLPDDLPAIEVPRVDRLPELPPRRYDVVAMADYRLTMLLRHDAGAPHADFQEDGGCRHVRGRAREASHADEVVAVTDQLCIFRRVLARFGHQYMGGQVYGGLTPRRLSQCGRTRSSAIYMADDAWRGFWLRAYVM